MRLELALPLILQPQVEGEKMLRMHAPMFFQMHALNLALNLTLACRHRAYIGRSFVPMHILMDRLRLIRSLPDDVL